MLSRVNEGRIDWCGYFFFTQKESSQLLDGRIETCMLQLPLQLTVSM